MSEIDPLYPVDLPEYTDAADIKKAFYRYHYGTDDAITDENEILPNSMAGYIKSTLEALAVAQNRLSEIPVLSSVTNLNTVTQNAIYLSTSNPSSANNYPTTSVGILSVVTDEDATYSFQIYQSITNQYFWRSGVKNFVTNTFTWGSWLQASDTTHTHSQYVQNDTLNNKVDSAIGASSVALRALATDASGKIITVAGTSSTDVARISGLTDNIMTLLGGKSDTSHTHPNTYYAQQSFANTAGVKHTARVFVQSDQPSAGNADPEKRPAAGDLWFW